MQPGWRLTYTHLLTDDWMMFESPIPRDIADGSGWIADSCKIMRIPAYGVFL